MLFTKVPRSSILKLPQYQARCLTSKDSSRIVDEREVAKFDAADWWGPTSAGLRQDGNSVGPLHTMQPVRLSIIEEFVNQHSLSGKLFSDMKVLDVGCGGGILSESLGHLGAQVVGIDPSPSNIAAATNHVKGASYEQNIRYRNSTAEQLLEEGEKFDLVCALEVIEHVPDATSFLQTICKLVDSDGILAISTMNKTLKSLTLAVVGAEYVAGIVPRGTHDWHKFQTPEFIEETIRGCGLQTVQVSGMVYNPLTGGWFVSPVMTDVNYMLLATKPKSLNST